IAGLGQATAAVSKRAVNHHFRIAAGALGDVERALRGAKIEIAEKIRGAGATGEEDVSAQRERAGAGEQRAVVSAHRQRCDRRAVAVQIERAIGDGDWSRAGHGYARRELNRSAASHVRPAGVTQWAGKDELLIVI